MTWTQVTPNSCCTDAYHQNGHIGFEDSGIRAYATCQSCGAKSRDVFLDGYTQDYDHRRVPNNWYADADGCAPHDEDEGEGTLAAHEWGDWRFYNKGDRVQAERECERCQTVHQHIYVYRYTEYETATLPPFTEGDCVWYEPDPENDAYYAEATVVAADHDAETYELRIDHVPVEDSPKQYALVAGHIHQTSGDRLTRVDS